MCESTRLQMLLLQPETQKSQKPKDLVVVKQTKQNKTVKHQFASDRTGLTSP